MLKLLDVVMLVKQLTKYGINYRVKPLKIIAQFPIKISSLSGKKN